jgi:tetratricopeptide (TPR) repeat protein
MIEKNKTYRAATLACLFSLAGFPALADAISPAITGDGKQYSKDVANSAFFGTGISGRFTEASQLRFDGEQETATANYDVAVKKLNKAVQLDPADPTGHLLLARALTAKVRSSRVPDPEALTQAISEWKLIWHHDADLLEQVEGRREAQSLTRMAKALAKQKEQGVQSQVATKAAPAKL